MVVASLKRLERERGRERETEKREKREREREEREEREKREREERERGHILRKFLRERRYDFEGRPEKKKYRTFSLPYP